MLSRFEQRDRLRAWRKVSPGNTVRDSGRLLAPQILRALDFGVKGSEQLAHELGHKQTRILTSISTMRNLGLVVRKKEGWVAA